MTLAKLLSPALMTGTDAERVEELRKFLNYPVQQRDPGGSRFYYLHPGKDESEARETCPIAVGFYSELNDATDKEIRKFLTDGEPQPEIYKHYTSRTSEDQPVMYLLLPAKEGAGRVPLILPNEGGLRSRQIQTFDWNEPELLARLSRLRQGELPIAERAMCSVPLVEWVFYEPIKTAGELARNLAEVARKIEKAIPKVYAAEKKDGYLHKLLESFQKELLPTLQLTSTNEKDYSFADIYAQTIAYGLFTARVFSYVKDEREGKEKETDFNRQDAWKQLPETNPFLRKLFRDVSEQTPQELGDELMEAVSEIFSILRAAKMDAILSDFQQKINQEDIVIRFYEDFLAAYKPQMRERRGVYYTPEPVVSYMVRSVDEMLKDKFNKPLGLADPEVMILDPACGTGTFLLWICQLIHKRFQESPEALTEGLADKSWSSYVKERLLPRIFGFELLMAPYAIAHLKLGLFLEETGYQFDSGKRLGVYLTNTLEDSVIKTETLFGEFIAEEASQATDIKRNKQIMVVLGNPPYSYESGNTGEWISGLVRDYYQVDGQSLGERNPKGLQDDYVKFIRFGQWRIDLSEKGIFAFITNHGFLDNPTFRGMRQQLIRSFDTLYFSDLHGNTKKKEKSSDGSLDENVFDIQQGVSITLGIKGVEKSILHSDLYGSRELKYNYLNKHDVSCTNWKSLNPQSPFYLFIPLANTLLTEYNKSWKLTDVFPINSLSIVTARDALTIHHSEEETWHTVTDFSKLQAEEARIKYALGKDTRDWQVSLAQEDLKASGLSKQKVTSVLYRPFDRRYTYYTGKSRGFHCTPRGEVMRHMLGTNNLGLIANRQVKLNSIQHFWASDSLVDRHILETANASAYLFPLYIHSKTEDKQKSAFSKHEYPNLSNDFLKSIEDKIGHIPNPEIIFYYIYAIFHSPTYRTRYAEFLKIDFPRVPLTSCDRLFCQLATYGEELVALHLMKSPKLDNLITQFIEDRGDRLVDAGHPKFNQGEVVINKKGDKFTGVPENVWNFHVGGYQVCQKWLKDRKGRTLSNEDIQHYQRIVVALKETIEIMENIDKAIPSFPIQ